MQLNLVYGIHTLERETEDTHFLYKELISHSRDSLKVQTIRSNVINSSEATNVLNSTEAMYLLNSSELETINTYI